MDNKSTPRSLRLKENYKHQEAMISKDAYCKEEEFDSSVESVYFENIMIGPI